MYEKYLIEESNKVKAGKDYSFYLLYCTACKKYKRIAANAPAGPGGTLSCPLCRERKENGPHIENAYGSVKVKVFKMKLPKEVDLDESR